VKGQLSDNSYQTEPLLGLADRYERFLVVAFQPFSDRNLERFGARWLLNAGKKVDLIDVSCLVWDQPTKLLESKSDFIVLRPRSWKEFERFAEDHADSSLAILCGVIPQLGPPLFRVLDSLSLPVLYFESGRLPRPCNYGKRLTNILQLMRTDPGKVFEKGLRLAKSMRNNSIDIDYLVMGGKATELDPPKWVKKAKRLIPAHSYDYVVWNSSRQYKSDTPYVVFLDQAYPDHTDPINLKLNTPFRRDVYYPEMVKFLTHASRLYSMPVIVALHPRATLNGDNPYGTIEAIVGHTASLVKGASLVIAHDTAAISFAVLGRKRLLLVKLPEMAEWTAEGIIDRLAESLGAPLVFLEDHNLPPIEEMIVNEHKYDGYEKMYLRHPSCNGIPVWDRVFDSGPDGISRSVSI